VFGLRSVTADLPAVPVVVHAHAHVHSLDPVVLDESVGVVVGVAPESRLPEVAAY
jgi:hypothetical protein